ncbi:MAG TPA: RDD family protein, partial [Candidatus Limnocylindria bacterium]|nr:RDD family protein [Candidatus Limnocylindria bacterium]
GLIISFVVILLGVIWVAFDSRKQGWHDKLAKTLVVRR